jgi:hypothetical protein
MATSSILRRPLRCQSASGGGLKLAFAVTTPDGWQVEIKSNRPLDRGLRKRLDLMLQGALDCVGP